MKPDLYSLSKEACGIPLLFQYDEKSGKVNHRSQMKNTILYAAADIIPQILAGNTAYQLGAMYLEFSNGAVSIPTFDRSGGISYYNGLGTPVGHVDYLRVPLSMAPTFTNDGSGHYTDNIVTFFATSSATTGRWGLTFSQGAGSKVFGVAIAATPVPADPSQDVVFARTYSNVGPVNVGITKYDGSQIGVLYPFQFS